MPHLNKGLLSILLTMVLCLTAQAQTNNVILVLGDSLCAEYGLRRHSGWVQHLSNRLPKGQYSVINASISGETTSGGLVRLPGLLEQHQPKIVIIALGANDGLRGLSLVAMRQNLTQMVLSSQEISARVVLVGMRLPPNFGHSYSKRFFSTFKEIAQTHKTAYVPFLLEGFADQIEYFQPDRIHPTEEAQPKMLNNVWPHLEPLLQHP